jgi:chromosome segregation ATPase
MELQTEKLEESILSKIKELNNRKNELTINAGQLHLDVAELKKVIEVVESEYSVANKELNTILADLNQKYPNGEIYLVEGTLIYQK